MYIRSIICMYVIYTHHICIIVALFLVDVYININATMHAQCIIRKTCGTSEYHFYRKRYYISLFVIEINIQYWRSNTVYVTLVWCIISIP